MIATLLPQRVSVQEPVAFDQGSVSLARFPEMADLEWLPARQLREYYVDPVATDIPDAQRRLYLAVVTGEIRARLKGRIIDHKQIVLMSGITPFGFPFEIELLVEDARRKWGGP
jgi:hypothetical protein